MLQNSTAGKRFFGKHFWPGVAEYRDGDTVTRVLLKEDTIRKMNPTFEGKPVFVEHVDEVIDRPLDDLKQEADGWVIKSFYNEADGDTWAEFLVTSQKGLDAINKGWKLSNAYVKTSSDTHPGLWNGVEYQEEVTGGNYEHLAIVSNPRYAGIILTPDEFKKYNDEKKAELSRLQNSLPENQQESSMAFELFKKTKVEENQIDLKEYEVNLGNGRTVGLADLVKEASMEMKEIKDQIILINEEKDERMTIEEAVKEIKNLRNKCNELQEKLNKKNEDDKAKEDKKDNEDKKDDKDKEGKKENSDGEPAKENEDDKDKDDKKDNEDDKAKEDKKDNEDKEDDKDKPTKNFLNDILNAKQICDNAPAVQKVLSLADRAELARKYF